jgi:hypothetical protein
VVFVSPAIPSLSPGPAAPSRPASITTWSSSPILQPHTKASLLGLPSFLIRLGHLFTSKHRVRWNMDFIRTLVRRENTTGNNLQLTTILDYFSTYHSPNLAFVLCPSAWHPPLLGFWASYFDNYHVSQRRKELLRLGSERSKCLFSSRDPHKVVWDGAQQAHICAFWLNHHL